MPRPPHKPCPRTVALENAAFLRELRHTGNAKAAALAIGRDPCSMRRRRKRMPEFATEWRAAMVVADARLEAKRNGRMPESWTEAPRSAYRAKGGEPVIARGRNGRLQQRAARTNDLTSACEQAFLLALSVTANVGLAAAAAGSSTTIFYNRRRRNEAFAREWRLALEEGYARVEQRLLAAVAPESHGHDAWAHNEPPEPPPMTTDQMLQLMYLHQKEVRLLSEPADVKRRRGESAETYNYRVSAMMEEGVRRQREKFRAAEAARAARGEPTWLEWDHLALPDLAQVRAGRGVGASAGPRSAEPPTPAKTPHHPGRALFGGWRIEDLEARREGRRRG